MPPHPGAPAPLRRLVLFLVAVLLGTFALFTVAPTGSAAAADGPAPSPQSLTVIADVHTDAVATFWDDGQLSLASKADVPELHTRYEADDVWFHVDDDSRIESLPAGYDFVAPAGSTVWLAPETQQTSQLWPGFSTESVPAGTLDNDDTTLTLVDVDGPGEVEVWQTGTFGAAQRLWSSDETGHKSFTRKRVHMHANWAFTAAGSYRLTVRADAAVGGTPVSDTAVYTFVVGGLPADVDTTASLEASDTSLTAGDPVALTAAVSPAGVAGFVEFHDGSNVLGHTAVEDGRAEMEVPDLAVGSHDITAVFVPAVENLANTSTSAPVTITVTDESGVPFGIAGVAESYEVGDVLRARVAGHTLTEGESYRWLIRPVEKTSSYVFSGTGSEAAQGRLEQLLDARHDGYEIQAQLRQGSTPLSETPWVPLAVADAVTPVTTTFPAGPRYLGDDVVFPLQGRTLAEGETARLVYRFSSPWYDVPNSSRVGDTIVARPPYATGEAEFSVQVVRDGVVLAQSDPVLGSISEREVLVQGVQGVYRVGQTLGATATVHPPSTELTYRWSVQNADYSLSTLKEGTTEDALRLELPMTMDLHDRRLYFHAVAFHAADGATPTEIWAGTWSTTLKVSDSDPSEQLLFFENLGDHYHQGNQINLNLVADPPLADNDTITWEWQWPGTGWVSLPGASGLSHTLTAEQALDGVAVRGTLHFADSDETLVAEPVTIHVDDHGAAARQQPTVGGTTSYTEGDTVTLTRLLPENGPTVLTDHRWEKQAAGTEDWSVVEGATGAELTFPATLADDGAQYRVSILKPGGEAAYGPSPAVELQVEQGSTEPADGLRIDGLAHHYHSGNTITLTAVPADDAPATYRWATRRTDQSSFHAVDGESGPSFTATAEQALHGTQVKVERILDGEVAAASEPVTVVVDDHGAPAPQVVSISGPTAYHEGAPVSLTASVAPGTVLDHYQWYLTPAGSDVPQPVAGATSAAYSFTATPEHDGAALTVAVTGDNGLAVYGPSRPHVLSVAAPDPEPAATTVTAADVRQIYGRKAELTVAVTPNATGTVEVTLPGTSRKLTGTLANGQTRITLPARLLNPGKRTLTISYAGVTGTFQPSTGTATVTVVKATPKVKVEPGTPRVEPGGTATFTVTVTAAGVPPTGVVTVAVAGKTKATVLNKQGQATVKISLPPRTPAGTKAVTVSYLGDTYVAKGETATTIRVLS
ncbi:choice-of-anchor M domain-containing protein [Plantactinospora sp. WMMC1484]|uniref:choice-of-anchor M domain-containing protein n=1 Tax=Plantactinospora sp. WMMC1484 TaxID=3404122 RepID=UPI003BF513E4